LAKTLAKQHNTQWVPEYSRTYLQEKFNKTGKICEISDLMTIAQGQIDLENKRAKKANKYLFCDTNLLETYVYARIYFPDQDFSELKSWALRHTYDFYFLTHIDIPWIPDDLRDKPKEREIMFEAFKNYLIEFEKKFYIIEGKLNQRIEKINRILENQNV